VANTTYFVQECPTCGRRLQVRVEYLGKRVVCQHCQGAFTASDPAVGNHAEFGSALLQRANELLDSVARSRSSVR
jgi:hypothetical protein